MLKKLWPVILLAGCAYERTYSHPTKSQAELQQDEYECTKDAYNAGGLGPYVAGGGQGRGLNIPLLNQCMAAKGYTWKEKGLR